MFGFGKKDKPASPPAADKKASGETAKFEAGFLSRLQNGLSRTRGRLTEGISSLVLGEKVIDASLLEDIETQLLVADVGIEATDQVIGNLKKSLSRSQLAEPEQFLKSLKK